MMTPDDFLDLPNVKRLLAVRDQIDSEPGSHDQDHWARVVDCNTTMCFAGHTCVMAGGQLVLDGAEIDDDGVRYASKVNFAGQTWTVEDLAEKLLGINRAQACALFFCDNHEWREIVEEIHCEMLG